MPQMNSAVEKRLAEALYYHDFVSVRVLLKEHGFLREKQHEENSLFQMCLRNHARDMVNLFLAEDPTLAIKINYTQAHQYAEQNDLVKLAEVLKSQPELLHATDSFGNTPLHLAATQGNVEVIQYLHQQGASLTVLNSDQNSPLQLALLFDQHPEKNAVKYIINESCANQNIEFEFLASEHEILPPVVNDPNALKQITQESWDGLLQNYFQHYYGFNGDRLGSTELLNIGKLLLDSGYLPTLENIKVGSAYMMNNMDFSGLSFDHCQFNGSFSHVKFSSGAIVSSEFDHAYFNHSEFGHGTNFLNTSFTDTYFQNVELNQTIFKNALFSHTSFENTTSTQPWFENSFMSHSNLLGLTISEPQKIRVLMDNTVYHSEMSQGFSGEVQFLNTDAPVIGLISGPYEIIYGGEVGMTGADPYARLKQYGATPVLLNMGGVMESINPFALAQEIKTILSSIPEEIGMSIPKYVLSQHGENLDKVKAIATDYAKHLDAAWIPGGPDVHPEFYGHMNTASSTSDYNYLREIFEFTIIDHMVTHNKPLMGICHGSQITNVYFGGTLKQDVEGHHEDHKVLPVNQQGAQEGVVSEVLYKPTDGVSAHHQSIDKLGEGLQVVAVSGHGMPDFTADYTHKIQTVIEASEGTNGKPIMLFQFHPEYNVDETNRDILNQFVSLAKESKQAHKMIDQPVLVLNDILDLNQTIPGLESKVIGHPLLENMTTISGYVPELSLPPIIHHTDNMIS
jgi:gamma-glutamyl-gamma-aminobutyrate hydrolase PuuD